MHTCLVFRMPIHWKQHLCRVSGRVVLLKSVVLRKVCILLLSEKNAILIYQKYIFISGDRILSVNGESVIGKNYRDVVNLVKLR